MDDVNVKTPGRLSRRELMKGAAMGGFLLPTMPGLLAACGSASGSKTRNFTVAMSADPNSLVDFNGDADSALCYTAMLSRLVHLDNKFIPQPDAADSWTISPDATEYTFHLNPKAKWHDGVPATSADWVYSFNEIFMTQSPYPSFIKFKGASAPDPYTFVIKLAQPFAGLLTIAGFDMMFVYPKHLYAGKNVMNNSHNNAPVGTGPFKFGSWVHGQYVELLKNTSYFRPNHPYLDRILLVPYENPSALGIAFQQDQISYLYAYLIPLDQLAQFEASPKFKTIHGGLGTGPEEFIVFNLKNRYLQSVQVRQAIAHAIDRQSLVQQVTYGAAGVAHGMMAASQTYYDGTHDVYDYNPAKANALLDAAGFPRSGGGKRFNLRLAYPSSRTYEASEAAVVASDLGKVGIGVSIQTGDTVSIYGQIYTKFDFDMALQLKTTGPDPVTGLAIQFSSAAVGVPTGNGGHYKNPQVDQLLAQGTGAQTSAGRRAAYSRAQAILMRDLPWLPLFDYPPVQLTTANVTGVIDGAVDYFPTYASARFV